MRKRLEWVGFKETIISLMGEEMEKLRDELWKCSMVTRIEFPRFRGDDVRGWLFKSEHYFKLNNIPDESKMYLPNHALLLRLLLLDLLLCHTCDDLYEEIESEWNWDYKAHYRFLWQRFRKGPLPAESSSIDYAIGNRKDDSNVTPDSSNICNNDNQVDQNAAECVADERAALANLIANLTLDMRENKRF
ncbi:hypothetical protein Tco_0545751 [Tanacetum coccineum]